MLTSGARRAERADKAPGEAGAVLTSRRRRRAEMLKFLHGHELRASVNRRVPYVSSDDTKAFLSH